MKVYGNPLSTCTRKVLMTFAEKKVTPEFQFIDLGKGEHKKPEFLAHQPFGQVPALQDGDFEMYESRAIIRYVDEVLPGVSLTPKDAKGRAKMEQWISVETSNFTPHAMAIVGQRVFAPMRGGQPDMTKIEAALSKLRGVLEILDKNLAKGPHFLGDAFSLADVCYMPYFEYLAGTPEGSTIAEYKNVAAWWSRVRERPTWQQVLSFKG